MLKSNKSRRFSRSQSPGWSKAPRAYIVLWNIGRLDLFHDLLELGFSDFCFPVEATALPPSLEPSVRSESTLTTESVQTSSPRTYLRKAISALQLRTQKSNSKSQGRRWPRVHERVVSENDVARSIPQMPSLTNSASIQLSAVGIDSHQFRAHQASFCHVFEGRLHRCIFAAVNLHLNSSVPRDGVAFLPIVVLECVKFLKSESTHPLPTTFRELY